MCIQGSEGEEFHSPYGQQKDFYPGISSIYIERVKVKKKDQWENW